MNRTLLNVTSVSQNLGQGLGMAYSNGGGTFAEYHRATSFPGGSLPNANCERAHVHFAGEFQRNVRPPGT